MASLSLTKKFLEYLGIEPERLQFSWVSASEGGKFAEIVTEALKELQELGPNKLFDTERHANGETAQ